MRPPRSFPFKLAVAVVALLLALFLARTLWLPVFGDALVRDDGPAKADIAVVLAGGESGDRILKAAELIRQGYVPAALVSCSEVYYGIGECDAAIPLAVRRGYPSQWFIPFPNKAHSTREEAALILPLLRRRGARSFLLVTSNYHTARAARIYRSMERTMGGGPAFRAVPAPDPFFHASTWWEDRESRKTFLLEWCKTLTGPLGM